MPASAPRDYSLIAPVYDKIFNKLLTEGHQEIGMHLKKYKRATSTKEFKVLEVGVGSGLTLDYLPPNIDYTGIDINKKMLSLAVKRSQGIKRRKIKLLAMDAHCLSFKANNFDLIVGASVITAVEDPIKVIKEMMRVGKRGSKIALVANVRDGSLSSSFVKSFDPFTKKLLGFRTDIEVTSLKRIKGLQLLECRKINNLMGFPLSSFLIFEKL